MAGTKVPRFAFGQGASNDCVSVQAAMVVGEATDIFFVGAAEGAPVGESVGVYVGVLVGVKVVSQSRPLQKTVTCSRKCIRMFY